MEQGTAVESVGWCELESIWTSRGTWWGDCEGESGITSGEKGQFRGDSHFKPIKTAGMNDQRKVITWWELKEVDGWSPGGNGQRKMRLQS